MSVQQIKISLKQSIKWTDQWNTIIPVLSDHKLTPPRLYNSIDHISNKRDLLYHLMYIDKI